MDDRSARAFGFEGTWKDYAPIAFTNLLLTIVTLGIYRFWATTRTRRYLWSRTRFIDEHLEWAGTGLELFIGFLLVLALFGLPLLFLQFGLQALLLQGYWLLGFSLALFAFAWIFYLSGVAMFRMLRYRLSRTWWRGVRGGSNDRGWSYGWSHVWRNLVGMFSFYLMVPWAMMSLWNDRWAANSFGPFPFRAQASAGDVFKRYLLFYVVPLMLYLYLLVFGGSFMTSLMRPEQNPTELPDGFFGFIIDGVLWRAQAGRRDVPASKSKRAVVFFMSLLR